jgi:hypothetical protein
MDITVIHHFDHSTDEVFASITNPDDVTAKYLALGHSDVQVLERTEKKGAVVLRTTRIVPLDVPSFARRILSPKNLVTQVDEWSAPDRQGVRTGSFTVDAKGVPVEVKGRLRLAPDGEDAARYEIAVTVKCGVPLIGGKIADFVGKDTTKAVEHEGAWTAAHLARA